MIRNESIFHFIKETRIQFRNIT